MSERAATDEEIAELKLWPMDPDGIMARLIARIEADARVIEAAKWIADQDSAIDRSYRMAKLRLALAALQEGAEHE